MLRQHGFAPRYHLSAIAAGFHVGEPPVKFGTFQNSWTKNIEVGRYYFPAVLIDDGHPPEVKSVFRLCYAVSAGHLCECLGKRKHRADARIVADDKFIADARIKQP